ncbi:MAG TPA: nucleotidyltransferase family protein [Dongiaceae bacterium]|nr:nucleotidyltransferase family protein [Dongiaceae bacterium]
MPRSAPFSAFYLQEEWPLLLEACSYQRDTARVASLAQGLKDHESLLRAAEEHGVAANLLQALEGNERALPTSLLLALRERRRLQVLFSLSLTAELFRVLPLLTAASVRALVIKGPALSLRAYDDPSARPYADVDLLVRDAEIARASQVLSEAGYQARVPDEAIRAGKIPGEYLFRRPGSNLLFDLHTPGTFRYFPKPMPVEAYFARAVSLQLDGHALPCLAMEDEFVLIAIHGAKHFWERLMLVADIAALLRNCRELDWARVRSSAEAVGAQRMVRLALLLAQRFLKAPIPQEMKDEVESDSACARLARQTESWLPYGGHAAPPPLRRALYRLLMPGGFGGAHYLGRLSLATTEEDWAKPGDQRRSRVAEMLRRPFRLARKHRRDPND